MPHHIDITLPHQDFSVGTDEHRAEGMMAVPGGVARDIVCGAQMGEHVVAGHGRISICGTVDRNTGAPPYAGMSKYRLK